MMGFILDAYKDKDEANMDRRDLEYLEYSSAPDTTYGNAKERPAISTEQLACTRSIDCRSTVAVNLLALATAPAATAS